MVAPVSHLRAIPDDLVESLAAFVLLSDGDGEPQAVECCACGVRYDLGDPDETRTAMTHTCRLTHRCADHCPTCHPKGRR